MRRNIKDEGPSLSDEGPSGAAALPRRLERYSKAKAQALHVQAYLKGVLDFNQREKTVLSRFEGCASYLLFHHYLEHDKVQLHAANFCKAHLLCPFCAIRRGAVALREYLSRWEQLKASNGRLRPFLVTLTVKDGPDLFERFTHLQRAFQVLTKRRSGKGSGSSVWCKALGGVASYEVKRGENSKLWHPHLHCIALADCDNPISQAKLANEWFEITGDSFIVDVRPIAEDELELVGGFAEVFKYAVKFSSMEPADTLECWRLLRRRRLVQSFGLFYGVEIPEDLTDEKLDGPFIEYLYRFCFAKKRYQLERSLTVAGSPVIPDYEPMTLRTRDFIQESRRRKEKLSC